MVGKGIEPKASRIFHQCYVKCCKLQNLTPLNNVIPSCNGKVLDFCVDRIKYKDWPPILNALSCDLSLHSIAIRCRQPVKTVLEHVDCERLAKTVNKRAVVLTNFMLTNLVEAMCQLLSNTTLLTSLLLEGLPLKVPYLNPLCEAILSNDSLQHLYLPRCLIGDAGCLAVCKSVRCLPNILILDLSGCELTSLGASYIADIIKYQKIHRYSENWVHTLRYRMPELDTMAGLRRITVNSNPNLNDVGAMHLLSVLPDDLWIKAVDIQNCGLTEATSSIALQTLTSNTALVVLDLRNNQDIHMESLSMIRSALRANERGMGGQTYSWLGNVSGSSGDGRSVKSIISKNVMVKDRAVSTKKFVNKMNAVKKEKDYAEVLEDQLQEEISHRQQLEELNLQLVDQMKRLKQQHVRIWANGATSSGSEQSFEGSSRSGGHTSSSESSSSVPIDQSTLSYIQQAFNDIYSFIKNNQCHGQCLKGSSNQSQVVKVQPEVITELSEPEEYESKELRVNIIAKKAQSAHGKMVDKNKANKTTKSAHLLGDMQHSKETVEMKPDMLEKQMGDIRNPHAERLLEDMILAQAKAKKINGYELNSPSGSIVSDSSETLVYSSEPSHRSHHSDVALNPQEAFYSSTDEDSS